MTRRARAIRHAVGYCIVAALVAGAAPTGGFAQQRDSSTGQTAAARTITTTRLGSIHVSAAASLSNVVAQLRRLRVRYQTDATGSECGLTTESLNMSFFRIGAGPPGQGCLFSFGMVRRHDWMTTSGLHPGSPLVTLRRLYPHAVNDGFVGGAVGRLLGPKTSSWELRPSLGTARHVVLVAYIKRSVVVALADVVFGH